MIRLFAAFFVAFCTSASAGDYRLTKVGDAGSAKTNAEMPLATNCRQSSCKTIKMPARLLAPLQEAKDVAVGNMPAALYDGKVALPPKGTINGLAYFANQTKRYAHGILGDAVEAGSLVTWLEGSSPKGKPSVFDLPEDEVFEDLYPRIIDFEGSGNFHFVTLRSKHGNGASIAIYETKNGELELAAQTPYIGRQNRWRNIAGMADFTGDGHIEIAEVVTPHIGGTLNFWTWKGGKLELKASRFGFSNHFIGSRELELSAVADFDNDGVDDLALPDDSRHSLVIVGFDGLARGEKTLKEIARIPLPARIDKRIFVHDGGDGPVLTLGLSDDSVWAVHQ